LKIDCHNPKYFLLPLMLLSYLRTWYSYFLCIYKKLLENNFKTKQIFKSIDISTMVFIRDKIKIRPSKIRFAFSKNCFHKYQGQDMYFQSSNILVFCQLEHLLCEKNEVFLNLWTMLNTLILHELVQFPITYEMHSLIKRK